MFENMAEMMLKRDYDVYVFDTAPTANARQLLGMSKVYPLRFSRNDQPSAPASLGAIR